MAGAAGEMEDCSLENVPVVPDPSVVIANTWTVPLSLEHASNWEFGLKQML